MPPYKKRKAADSREEKDCESKSSRAMENEDSDLGADWREKCNSVSSKNSYALKNNILSDVKFIVGQAPTVFHGHRLILALGSPVFEAMFFGPLAEKEDTIVIPDVDAVGFQNLLEFLYTDDVVLKGDIDTFKTYFAADKYCITGLKKYCEEFLSVCKLTPSSVWIFLENSFYLNSEAIRDRCSCLLKEDIKHALEDDSFLDVNVKIVESLLSLNSLNISELDLLNKIITWAENKSKQENSDSFQNILRPLLKYIRFGSLTAKEFINLRKEKLMEMFSDQEALAILEHIIQPAVSILPDWCCSDGQRNSEFIKCKYETIKDILNKSPVKVKMNHAITFKRKICKDTLENHYLSLSGSYFSTESEDLSCDNSFSSSSSSSS